MTAALIILAAVIVAAWSLWPLLPEQVRRDTGRHTAPRPVNGRNLGDQPRRDQRPGRQPWLTAGQPVLPAPEPRHAYDPGDGMEPPVPLARPYAPLPLPVNDDEETYRLGAWGVVPQAEAARLASVFLP